MRSKIPPMPGWKTDEINWQLPILVLLNYKFNGVQSGPSDLRGAAFAMPLKNTTDARFENR